MFDLLQTIFNMLKNLFDIALSLFEDLVYIINLLGSVVTMVPSFIGAFIPAGVIGVIAIMLSVTVVYRVLGRD